MAPAGISPIESAAGQAARGGGTEITVGAGGEVLVNGESLADLAPELRQWLEVHAKVSPKLATLPIYVWPDRAASAARVAEVAAAVPHGREVRLAFLGPAPAIAADAAALVKQPEIAALRDRVTRLDPGQRAAFLAGEIQKAVGTCAPLVEAFGSVATVAADQKGAYLARAAPAALKKCGCAVGDLDVIVYAMLQIFGEWDRPMRWVPVAQAASVMGK